ncbi:MAG: serine/threonine protein kinase [Sandaracinaceae bacterium]|nr:serine/threonine protein kinase [Sandaracinaceae bacterium]
MTNPTTDADRASDRLSRNLGARSGTSLGRYELVRRIGSGGMAEVYEAVHRGLKKTVAIKVLLPEVAGNDDLRARFLREGEAASRIQHPHVVDVTDVGEDGGIPYLVMELLVGETLTEVIEGSKRLSVPRSLDILLPIAAALSEAHRRGVVHRDLKPDNIFIARTANGKAVPKLLDFGVSKLTTAGIPATRPSRRCWAPRTTWRPSRPSAPPPWTRVPTSTPSRWWSTSASRGSCPSAVRTWWRSCTRCRAACRRLPRRTSWICPRRWTPSCCVRSPRTRATGTRTWRSSPATCFLSPHHARLATTGCWPTRTPASGGPGKSARRLRRSRGTLRISPRSAGAWWMPRPSRTTRQRPHPQARRHPPW